MKYETLWTVLLEVSLFTIIVIEIGCSSNQSQSGDFQSAGQSSQTPSSSASGGYLTTGAGGITTINGIAGINPAISGKGGVAGDTGKAGHGTTVKGTAGRAGLDGSAGGSGASGLNGIAGASGSKSTAGAGGETSFDDCVETGGSGSTSAGGVSGYGVVFFYAPSGNPFVRLRTKMIVPKPPTKNGVLFLWPGLQPGSGGKNYQPIGQGVLQPVLTWGASCAPNQLGSSYDSWWISAQYVNTLGNYQGYTGCHGGPAMKVAMGDILDIDMKLSGTVWTQTVTNESNNKSVDFDWDLKGQDQNMALFDIEDTYNSPSEDLIFRSSVLTFASPAPSACAVGTRGTNDYVSTPRPLKDGLECCIPRIVCRARGVAATSPN